MPSLEALAIKGTSAREESALSCSDGSVKMFSLPKIVRCYGGGGTPGIAVRTPTAAVATAAASALATQ